MALFNNTYSGLITKGLGMPACCGLITMGFGLFKCTIEIIIPPQPPSGGGGGGSYAVHPGVYVEWPKKITPKTKMVLITVKMGEKAWRHSYTVDGRKASITVKAVEFINNTTHKISVGVDAVKSATRRVTAYFKDDDK
jgi:hypothetical protein